MYSIFLVEDEQSIRENIIKGILWEQYGFYVFASASNGEEALEKLETIHPDVLITDIRMPFMDGLELSRIAKRLLPNIKIIILSGYMEFAYAQEAIRIGVEEYIVKPITPAKVIRTFSALKIRMDEESQSRENYSELVGRLRDAEDQIRRQLPGRLKTEDLLNERKRDEMLWEFLQTGRRKNTIRFAEEYVSGIDKRLFESRTYCSYFLVGAIVMCMKEAELIGGDPGKLFAPVGNLDALVDSCSSVPQVEQTLGKVLGVVLMYRDQVLDRSAEVIRNAESYIRE
ncbi:MAG: response regulator, partial [Clostridiales bacterium]|nr:response regulator [Clostridiales bacterium]